MRRAAHSLHMRTKSGQDKRNIFQIFEPTKCVLLKTAVNYAFRLTTRYHRTPLLFVFRLWVYFCNWQLAMEVYRAEKQKTKNTHRRPVGDFVIRTGQIFNCFGIPLPHEQHASSVHSWSTQSGVPEKRMCLDGPTTENRLICWLLI